MYSLNIRPPGFPLNAGATEYHLPNSNQTWRLAISNVKQAHANPIDRRAIPADATESVWTARDAYPIRRIDWPGNAKAPRGSILFFPGRGDNYEKYLETLEQWHRAGWRVTAADWRGQAGSGRLADDTVTGHIDDFATWIDDLRAFWADWKHNTPGPHILSGHSMGGHLVLRGTSEGAVDPDALVLVAPMLGFIGPLPTPVGHAAAKMMKSFGDPKRPAWKWSEKPGEVPEARSKLLTHDKDRYEDELWWREERPQLVMGPGSWGWVERAYASMRHLFARGRMEAVQTPTLIIGTSNDKLVAISAIEEAARRIPNAELLRFGKEAHHEILREGDLVRASAMDTIDQFLDRVAPAKVSER
jgi:lysophospholipase